MADVRRRERERERELSRISVRGSKANTQIQGTFFVDPLNDFTSRADRETAQKRRNAPRPFASWPIRLSGNTSSELSPRFSMHVNERIHAGGNKTSIDVAVTKLLLFLLFSPFVVAENTKWRATNEADPATFCPRKYVRIVSDDSFGGFAFVKQSSLHRGYKFTRRFVS